MNIEFLSNYRIISMTSIKHVPESRITKQSNPARDKQDNRQCKQQVHLPLAMCQIKI